MTVSNKVVSAVYRNIIDDVINNVRSDFDEVGVEEAVLDALQRSWEQKVAQSRVADFSQDPRMGMTAKQFPMLPTTVTSAAAGVGLPQATTSGSKSVTTGVKVEESTSTSGTEAGGAAGEGTSSGNGVTATSTGTPDESEKKEKPKGDDDDLINSDLDDSDDDVDDEEDEGDSGDLVIALYEKVQRVKNKWKVTLKDGLVSVNGKEYLFAKCSGELEW